MAKALLIASTVLRRWQLEQTPYLPHPLSSGIADDEIAVLSADELAEFAGRACYESWDRPNMDTATNRAYLANIIRQAHFSVLEHASATFYITGVSRSLTHELIRHRHLSFSQLSQRFVDPYTDDPVVPPAVRPEDDLVCDLENLMVDAVDLYETIYSRLSEQGYSRKEAREAARAVLPNCTETAIVVTGNMRAWRDVIAKRSAPGADAEIRELASDLLRQLREIAPNTFQDMQPLRLVDELSDDGPIGSAVLIEAV